MHDEYKIDGNIHFITEDMAYCGSFFQEKQSYMEVKTLEKSLITKYVRYLMENESEKAIQILTEYFLFNRDDDLKIIYRPAYLVSMLAQNSILGLSFKRIDKGNKDEK